MQHLQNKPNIKILTSSRGMGNRHFVKYILVLYIYCQNFGIYVSGIYIFVLDIYCQQLGDICQLDIHIGIGYILPTIGGYV